MYSKNRANLYEKGLFRKQAAHDLSFGLVHNSLKFAPVILISLLPCFRFLGIVGSGQAAGYIPNRFTFADILLYTFQGMKVYDPTANQPFEIPYVWILLNLYLAFLIGNYLVRDLLGYGQQILIRSRKRGQWWLSKCLWCLCTVLAFYGIVYIVHLLVTFISGTFSMSLTPEIAAISELDVSAFPSRQWALSIVLLPFLTSVAMSMMQLALILYSKPLGAFVIVTAIFVVSAYYFSSFLIGNYSMMLRSSLNRLDGLHFTTAIFADTAITAISIIAGWLYFKHYDILDKV